MMVTFLILCVALVLASTLLTHYRRKGAKCLRGKEFIATVHYGEPVYEELKKNFAGVVEWRYEEREYGNRFSRGWIGHELAEGLWLRLDPQSTAELPDEETRFLADSDKWLKEHSHSGSHLDPRSVKREDHTTDLPRTLKFRYLRYMDMPGADARCNCDAFSIIDKMRQMGARPATFEELLAFEASYPKEIKKSPLVALGSAFKVCGNLKVPAMYWHQSKRWLGVRHITGRFHSSFGAYDVDNGTTSRFLVVYEDEQIQ